MGRINSHLWVNIGILALGANIAFLTAGLIRRDFHLNKLVSLVIGILVAVFVLWFVGFVMDTFLNMILGNDKQKPTESQKQQDKP